MVCILALLFQHYSWYFLKVWGYPQIQYCQKWLNDPYRRFYVSFFTFTFPPEQSIAKYRYIGIYRCERAEWRTHVLIYYDSSRHYYSPNSWKFQTACISLNISRPLNPIKLKSSSCLWYIWSYRSVTSLMGVGSTTPKLWYLLPIFYTHSKDKWLGLSTHIPYCH